MSSPLRSSPLRSSPPDPDAAGEQRPWNVKDYMCLPRIPPLYALERTRATVRGSPPEEVARLVASCLRSMSVDAAYDGERATAHARGADGTELYVRMFRGGVGGGGGRGAEVVVEVQKKRGCSRRYHRIARAVLRAAAGGAAVAPPPPEGAGAGGGRTASAALLPRSRRDGAGRASTLALESAEGLLGKDRMDANLLGMESMVLLTDPESVGDERALIAAGAVLRGCCGGDPSGPGGRIAALVSRSSSAGSGGGDDGDDDDDSDDGRHAAAMRRCALSALANSAAAMSRDSPAEFGRLLRGEGWLGGGRSGDGAGAGKGLLSALVDEVGRADSGPHEAYQAARCLGAVLAAAPEDVRRAAADLGARAALTLAGGVGRERHALLARESELGLKRLDSGGEEDDGSLDSNCGVLRIFSERVMRTITTAVEKEWTK